MAVIEGIAALVAKVASASTVTQAAAGLGIALAGDRGGRCGRPARTRAGQRRGRRGSGHALRDAAGSPDDSPQAPEAPEVGDDHGGEDSSGHGDD